MDSSKKQYVIFKFGSRTKDTNKKASDIFFNTDDQLIWVDDTSFGGKQQHSHSNKSILDGITQSDIDNWNGGGSVSAQAHTHANKSILDGISDASINLWNDSVKNVVASISGTNLTIKVNDITSTAVAIPTGPQGPQGVQGPKGPQGPQGPIGYQGYQGLKGDQGVQGPQGPQGRQGPATGVVGPQGDPGVQGPQGPRGYQGYQGNRGYQGYQGAQGAQGPQGDVGPSTGVTGPQGPQGVQGPQGKNGNDGGDGPQGSTGPQGRQGPRGYQGYQGNRGYQGYQGPPGDDGGDGAQGPAGPQGRQGPAGPQGRQGPAGGASSIWGGSGTNIVVGTTDDTLQTTSATCTTEGVMTADSYYANSDERLKENIKNVTINDLLVPVEFDWKESKKHSYGFIAQTLQKLGYPELINEDDNGFLKVNYDAAYGLAIACLCNKVKELEHEIELIKDWKDN